MTAYGRLLESPTLSESPMQAAWRLSAYGLLAILALLLWTLAAETELPDPNRPAVRGFGSLVKLADGTGPAPFVHRRLLPDAANGLAAIVPDSVWNGIETFTRGTGPVAREARSLLDYLHWNRRDYPVLFSGYLLIGLSFFGMMCVARRMVIAAYEVSPAIAAFLGAAAGLLLLGGCGVQFNEYPYDIPNAFVFNLALLGMMNGAWWMLPVFVLAAYSKETSILLVPAYALLSSGVPPRRRLVVGIAMALIVVTIRAAIRNAYPALPGANFYYLDRNVGLIARAAIYQMWVGSLIFLFLAGAIRTAPRRLAWVAACLIVPLVAACLFRGWIEERRAYLEALPVTLVAVLPWCFQQVGYPLKFRAAVKGRGW